MNIDIYHKIDKYKQKLENEPDNSIYQSKLKYYYQMMGGWNTNIGQCFILNLQNIGDPKIYKICNRNKDYLTVVDTTGNSDCSAYKLNSLSRIYINKNISKHINPFDTDCPTLPGQKHNSKDKELEKKRLAVEVARK